MGVFPFHLQLLGSGPGRSGHLPDLLLREWGRTCGLQSLLQLLGLRHFHPFWGNGGRRSPILHLLSLLPGHCWRSPSYSVASLQLRRTRRGCRSLLLALAQLPLRSPRLRAVPTACCPPGHRHNHSYRCCRICRDLGKRSARNGASRMTRTGQTCEEGGRKRGGREEQSVRGGRLGFLHLPVLLLCGLAFPPLALHTPNLISGWTADDQGLTIQNYQSGCGHLELRFHLVSKKARKGSTLPISIFTLAVSKVTSNLWVMDFNMFYAPVLVSHRNATGERWRLGFVMYGRRGNTVPKQPVSLRLYDYMF